MISHDVAQFLNKMKLDSLSKDWVELFGDVVFLVVDCRAAESDHQIWVSLAVDVSRVKVIALEERILRVASRENLPSGFPTRSDTNHAVQPQKMARGLKFLIYEQCSS